MPIPDFQSIMLPSLIELQDGITCGKCIESAANRLKSGTVPSRLTLIPSQRTSIAEVRPAEICHPAELVYFSSV